MPNWENVAGKLAKLANFANSASVSKNSIAIDYQSLDIYWMKLNDNNLLMLKFIWNVGYIQVVFKSWIHWIHSMTHPDSRRVGFHPFQNHIELEPRLLQHKDMYACVSLWKVVPFNNKVSIFLKIFKVKIHVIQGLPIWVFWNSSWAGKFA